MSNRNYVIYVPGLGDNKLSNRMAMLFVWKLRRMPVEICSMDWSAEEPWNIKLARLNNLIQRKADAGHTVSLIGESAGASAVTQAFNANEQHINAVILLCGKSQYPERVSQKLYKRYPALRDAISGSTKAISALTDKQKSQLLNVHPIHDPVVPVEETYIPGVKNSRMPVRGHSFAIVFANLFWTGRMIRFIKQRR